MSDATYVAFVPRAKREKLRSTLQAADTGAVTWREHRKLFGSEFYFSGPSGLVRKTHAYIVHWLAQYP